jgi:hypothetical protein
LFDQIGVCAPTVFERAGRMHQFKDGMGED